LICLTIFPSFLRAKLTSFCFVRGFSYDLFVDVGGATLLAVDEGADLGQMLHGELFCWFEEPSLGVAVFIATHDSKG
jgi:hypothetical protein